MDLFFVISGYLITKIILLDFQNKCFGYKIFYAARIRRIFPALILTIMASLLIACYFQLPYELEKTADYSLAATFFLVNLKLISDISYFDQGAIQKIFLHLWSLGVEEQFYLLWPFVMIYLLKHKVIMSYAIKIITFSSFFLMIFLYTKNEGLAFYLPLSRLWELSAGGMVAINELEKSERLTSNKSLWWSIFGLLLLIFSQLLSYKYLINNFLIVTAVISAVIFVKYETINLTRFQLSRLIVWLGKISYPLYLFHFPILYALHQSIFIFDFTNFESRLWRVVGIVITMITASMIYYFVEWPIRFGKYRNKPIGFLIAAMCLVFATGLFVRLNPNKVSFSSEYLLTRLELVEELYEKNPYGPCLTNSPVVDGLSLQVGLEFNASITCAGGASWHSENKILLWGDSHAAHFVEGMRSILSANNALIQETTGGCPPAINTGNETCKFNNNYVLSKIKSYPPKVLILSAGWTRYDLESIDLEKTIKFAKENGVETVVIVGPAPEWFPTLPKHLLKLEKNSGELLALPVRMKGGLTEKILELDHSLSLIAQKSRADYISLITNLCDIQTCSVAINNNLVVYDNDHFTRAGSVLLAPLFKKYLQ